MEMDGYEGRKHRRRVWNSLSKAADPGTKLFCGPELFVHSTNLLGYLGYSCLELVSLINKMYVVCETLAPYLF